MSRTIRLTITPDLEKALRVLRLSTSGALNTTELVKMAVGSYAKIKSNISDKAIGVEEWDGLSAKIFYDWAKEDGSLAADNISKDAKLKTFTPEPYVSNR